MPRIFLSYRQGDTEAVAKRVCERLRAHYGPRVTMEVGQIPLGADFRQFLARELEHSDAVLVLMGSRWLELTQSRADYGQDFVRVGIEIALERELLTVPLLIGSEPGIPRETELPAGLGRLAYLHGFRLLPEQPFEEQMQRFIGGLDHALSLRSGVVRPPALGESAEPGPLPGSGGGRKRRVECVELDLVWVEPGSFLMGSPNDEPGRWPDEGPRHRVEIGSGFWLGENAVTQSQFQAILETNPSFFREAGERAPVEMVSWRDAREFCLRLERREPAPDGFAYRLPTEAEWEYACRAGTQSALYNGPMEVQGANHALQLDPIAWYGGNSGVEYPGGVDSASWFEKQYDHGRAGTHPVAQKAPNAWGFFDMLGNVWEWCWDGKRSYEDRPVSEPMGSAANGRRVIRGGSWEDGPGDCRCATRFAAGETHRFSYLGFRLALAAKGSTEADGMPRA